LRGGAGWLNTADQFRSAGFAASTDVCPAAGAAGVVGGAVSAISKDGDEEGGRREGNSSLELRSEMERKNQRFAETNKKKKT
jgi:hypothetical protein